MTNKYDLELTEVSGKVIKLFGVTEQQRVDLINNVNIKISSLVTMHSIRITKGGHLISFWYTPSLITNIVASEVIEKMETNGFINLGNKVGDGFLY